MASIEELKDVRLSKIEKLKEAGMEPYAHDFSYTHTVSQILEQFEELSNNGETVTLVGRVMGIRGQGAIMFIPFNDGTGEFQAVLKKGELDDDKMNLFVDTIDGADFISLTGTLFKTERGAQSLLVKDWTILTKALRQLPDKYHGIQDTEESYRKRYLDILMDKDVKDRFILRSKIISAIRKYFDAKDFLEIETPILQNQAGGAMAKVFETYHNDYQMPMVLRIALELDHKILTTAGFNRVYEIGKNFRNEGSDPTHIQEFTMIEWYSAYTTLDENILWTEELLKMLARDVVGKTTFTVYDKEDNAHEVDFAGEWSKIPFNQLIKQSAGIEVSASLEDIQSKAIEYGMDKAEAMKTGKGNLLDHIFKKAVRINLIQPTFVLDYPSDLKPLAIQNGDGTARVAQLVIAGAEITNQYAELVDPTIQRKLLEDQAKAKEGGDAEAMSIDERFLTAMEHGMPPQTGFGMGIDRLVAIFTEQKNLRDVVFFPILKPEINLKNKE